ncbi:glycosyltransferase [Dyella sedimenti]|uniref:glycosyltransferase n=1 Tax=Dyella sedimenti TaxID=2919947 RepID=UPI001FAA6D40|nr:glycosyltransferase [Dyella sedimenti]
MKIAHVITGLNTGGAETILCRFLEGSRELGVEHTVIALGDVGTLSPCVGNAADLHHLRMRASGPRLGGLRRLRAIIVRSGAEVVHGWMYHGNIAATLATAGLGLSRVWGIHHSLYELHSEKRMTRMLIHGGSFLSRYTDRVLYCSTVSSLQHEALGYKRLRTQVIPNGFDVEALKPDPVAREKIRAEWSLTEDDLVIGLVARVHPVKDHENFLRAARILADQDPAVRFVLVGDGADASNASLNELIDRLSLRDRMRLCGRRTDIAQVNAALDIAALSSRGEAFPMAIGEAMACAVPCVATNVGDVPEIIGETGVVVPPRDHAALAAGWSRIARLEAAGRRALGESARQRIVDRFSMAAMNRRYVELYASLIQEARK